MHFRQHYELKGKHAILSPSKYSWIRYDDEKFDQFLISSFATVRGTMLHDLAAKCIEAKQRLPESGETLCMYVNDAISFGMQPEVALKYSDECFGTADAILFDEQTRTLRIHDLKTGVTPAKMDQLMIYAALFLLEYGDRLGNTLDISIELRIYQNNDVLTYNPTFSEVNEIMEVIIFRANQVRERTKEL